MSRFKLLDRLRGSVLAGNVGTSASEDKLLSSRGIVKLKLTAVFDAQHGGFTTGWSPVS